MTTDFDVQKIITEVDQGVIDNPNRIDPKVMTSIMAMAQAGQLAKIRKNLEDRTSEGWTQSFNFVITDTQTPPDGFKFDRAAQSISLRNDGPATIFVGLNSYDNPSTLLINETLNLDFQAHKLVKIYLRCGPTLTANARGTIKG